MAGKFIPICPPRAFDFLGVSSGSSADYVLKTGIDVREWRSAGLMVRTHVNSMAAGAGSISVFAQRESRSAQDPDILFANAVDQLGLITLNSATPVPGFDAQFLENASTTLGPMVRVVLRGTHDNGTLALAATVSVDLCLKTL